MKLELFFGPWSLFCSFVILYRVGSTPWTGDQPVARPLPTHRTAQTQNKHTHRHPCRELGSEPKFSGNSFSITGCKMAGFNIEIIRQTCSEGGYRLFPDPILKFTWIYQEKHKKDLSHNFKSLIAKESGTFQKYWRVNTEVKIKFSFLMYFVRTPSREPAALTDVLLC
jgi:hypothetical protein